MGFYRIIIFLFMISIYINDLQFYVSSKFSVLEACKYIGIIIPKFCYHETLSIAGNCRMCLIEVLNSPKPIASCAMPLTNNMKIYTDSPLVKKTREIIIENLLLNHPLDCPICDQGGECDLQDQTKKFGGITSRNFFKKRVVEDKNLSPIIKTIMTRCIHCTRCVRFSIEIAGTETLSTLNRGKFTEIGNYVNTLFLSEISGNVIELCPVGALTLKSYSFKARPWELRTVDSIDLTDGSGSNIYFNYKETEILRVMPKVNKEINLNLISDKTRFFYDALKNDRLNSLLIKQQNSYNPLNWESLFLQLEENFLKKKINILLIDETLDFESLILLKLLSYQFKNLIIKTIKPTVNQGNFFINWQLNSIKDIKKFEKICFLFSTNLRLESAILNTKIRIKSFRENLFFYGTALSYKTNFFINFINLNLNEILKIFEAKDSKISKLLVLYKNPIFFLGQSLILRGLDYINLSKWIKNFFNTAVIINLNLQCNSTAFNFFNFRSITSKNLVKSTSFFFINLDDLLFINKIIYVFKNKQIFWANTNNSQLAIKSDFLIPLKDAFEEENLFINLEERSQRTLTNTCVSRNSRSLKIFLNLFLKKNKNYSFFIYFFELAKYSFLFLKLKKKFNNYLVKIQYKRISLYPIKLFFEDFYRSNKQVKKSLILAEVSYILTKTFNNFFL